MNDKLKPCPFCGHNAEMAEEMRVHGIGEKKWYRPICPECMCDLGYFDNMDEAIEAWNKRVNNEG